MKRMIILLIIFCFAAGLNTRSARADLILNPTDDTYIRQGDNGNFDGSGLLAFYTRGTPCINTEVTYLRFDVSALPEVGPTTEIRVYVVFEPLSSESLALWSTGDDWNGGDAGLGGEETLTGTNEPAPIALLDTKPSGIAVGWIEFTGASLSSYINTERTGDGIASFLINWNTCSAEETDTIAFEDRENFTGSGNIPELYPFSPTAITLKAFAASSNSQPVALWLVLGIAVLALGGLLLLRKRRQA